MKSISWCLSSCTVSLVSTVLADRITLDNRQITIQHCFLILACAFYTVARVFRPFKKETLSRQCCSEKECVPEVRERETRKLAESSWSPCSANSAPSVTQFQITFWELFLVFQIDPLVCGWIRPWFVSIWQGQPLWTERSVCWTQYSNRIDWFVNMNGVWVLFEPFDLLNMLVIVVGCSMLYVTWSMPVHPLTPDDVRPRWRDIERINCNCSTAVVTITCQGFCARTCCVYVFHLLKYFLLESSVTISKVLICSFLERSFRVQRSGKGQWKMECDTLKQGCHRHCACVMNGFVSIKNNLSYHSFPDMERPPSQWTIHSDP